MLGLNAGMLVEIAVALLLAVTIGYCVLLNHRLKRLHQDRETMLRAVSDLVQATGLAHAAVKELKTAALEAETQLGRRIEEARSFSGEIAASVESGGQLVARIAKITAAARNVPIVETKSDDIEPQSRLLGPALTLGFQGLADRMVDDFVRVADRWGE